MPIARDFNCLNILSVIFIHASMRLRNLRNKLQNKMEWVGLSKSPMGVILEAIGLECDVNM